MSVQGDFGFLSSGDSWRGVVARGDRTNDIVCADCMDYAERVDNSSFDFMLTDPPYSMPATYAVNGSGTAITQREMRKYSDHLIMRWWFSHFLAAWLPKMKPDCFMAIFCDLKSLSSFYPPLYERANIMHLLTWQKNTLMGGAVRKNSEQILLAQFGAPRYNSGTFTSVIPVPSVPSAKRLHPVEKPYRLFEILIQQFAPAEDAWVIDPFGGGCITHFAARGLGRNSLTIEYEPEFVDRATEKHNGLYGRH